MAYGHPAVSAFVGGFDVIVCQRNIFVPEVWAACDYWRALGKLVVADLDDDYPRLTAQNPARPFWLEDVNKVGEKSGKRPLMGLREGLRHIDALCSPSKVILSDWADIVQGFHWPNYAHGSWYDGIGQNPTPADGEDIIVGWGGSVSHFDSWWFSGLREAMNPLLEAHPRLKWKICGNDWRLYGEMERLLPEDRWIYQTGVPAQEWPKQVASFDIGVAPLAGASAPQAETYDNRRSWLKAVEYLLCGVPWLASPGPVYEDLDGRGGTCLEANTPEAWFDAVSGAIENLQALKAASAELTGWARDNLTMEAQAQNVVRRLECLLSEKHVRDGIRLPDIIYVEDALQAQTGGAA